MSCPTPAALRLSPAFCVGLNKKIDENCAESCVEMKKLLILQSQLKGEGRPKPQIERRLLL